MQTVALPALVFDLTHRATWIGYASMASLMPAVLLTPYAGVLCDRVSRRKILIITQVVQMTSALVLWSGFRSGSLTPQRILALSLVNGIASGFQTAAWQSFVPLLVPREDMIGAVKVNSMQYNLARALGPGFAGIVIRTWGTGAAFLINAVTYPLVIAVLVVANPRANAVAAKAMSVKAALASGGRYVWRHRALRLAVILATLNSLCGQALQHTSAAIAARIFGRPSTDNAGLLMALGFGSILSTLLSGVWGRHLRRSRQVAAGLSCYLACAVAITATSSYTVGLIAYFVGGFGHLLIAVALNTMIQGYVPDDMRGRAVSYYILGVLVGIPVGTFLLGRAADAFGMRWAVAGDAAVMAVVLGVVLVRGSMSVFDRIEMPKAGEAAAAAG